MPRSGDIAGKLSHYEICQEWNDPVTIRATEGFDSHSTYASGTGAGADDYLNADLDEDEDADADVATNTEFDEGAAINSGYASDEQASEAEANFYQQSIAQCDAGGPTMDNQGENTNNMTTSEEQKWNM
ncbi:hypothetical protein DL767_005453 [Monosporascus sp. MG133]|nr:hypothetical protein DL767_005453 [Monosporascus sp. MG133]